MATITGTEFDDTLTGTADSDLIFGLDGNDLLIARGDDLLIGGEGDDTLAVEGGLFAILGGGAGDDTYLFTGDGGNFAVVDELPGEGRDTVVVSRPITSALRSC